MGNAIDGNNRKQRPRKHNEGVALILTLLFVVLLTVLVVEFAYEAQVEASYALNSENEFQVRLAARSAIYNGIAILETDRLETELAATEGGGSAPSDSRLSAWAQPGTFDPLNEAVMRTSISDEFSKINLNALVYYDEGGEALIRAHIQEALIYFFGKRDESVDAEAIVDALVDWIDDNEEVYENGSESDFYESSENPYPCKNGPMDSIEEFLLVRGVTPELYFWREDLEPVQLPLSEYLTVHGDWLGRINPNTVYADYDTGISEVLEAMREGWIADSDAGPLASDVDIEGILAITLDVEAAEPFNSVDQLSDYVTVAPEANTEADDRLSRRRNRDRLASGQSAASISLRKMFTVYSHIFRIQGDALLDDILVRNEAYVLRVPTDPGSFELPLVQQGSDPSVESVLSIMEQWDVQEFYRILEWKVIQ